MITPTLQNTPHKLCFHVNPIPQNSAHEKKQFYLHSFLCSIHHCQTCAFQLQDDCSSSVVKDRLSPFSSTTNQRNNKKGRGIGGNRGPNLPPSQSSLQHQFRVNKAPSLASALHKLENRCVACYLV